MTKRLKDLGFFLFAVTGGSITLFAIVSHLASCECGPGELDADSRTPQTAIACYDQAYGVVRDCRTAPGHGGPTWETACLRVLDEALNLCDRHYGQPYHNGNRPDQDDDDTDTGDGEKL